MPANLPLKEASLIKENVSDSKILTSQHQAMMARWNQFFRDKSYVEGWSFSQADVNLFRVMEDPRQNAEKYPHLFRWYTHIKRLVQSRFRLKKSTKPRPIKMNKTRTSRRRPQNLGYRQLSCLEIVTSSEKTKEDVEHLWKELTGMNYWQKTGVQWGQNFTICGQSKQKVLISLAVGPRCNLSDVINRVQREFIDHFETIKTVSVTYL